MHIPDSVLSPATCAAAGAAMIPVWHTAARKVRRSLGTRQMPLLALGASFCFTIMMFNIPALGGTTAHPVAGTLLAVMLGPWAACIGISVALLIQALFFGDGGLLAYGANCFTMAFVLPFTGYAVYRVLTHLGGANRPMSAAVGAFVGLNAAAAAVALLLGIQPGLFHETNGHALYFPFDLHVTLPAMLATHLAVAGPAEAVVTGLAVRYLTAAGIALYGVDSSDAAPASGLRRPSRSGGHTSRALAGLISRRETMWVALGIIVVLTPLGLLARGEAWGEWDAKGVMEQTERRFGPGRGYTPKGLQRADSNAYRGVHGLQDYASNDGRNRLGYLGAALLGVSTICCVVLVGGRLMRWWDPETTTPGSATSVRRDPAVRSSEDLPLWMRSSRASTEPGAARRQSPYLERTLSELAGAAAARLQADRWARSPGLLQGIDARAKIITLLLLVIVTGLTHRPSVLAGLYLSALALGMASRLPIGLLLKRVWLAVPVFVAAIALPVALSAFTPGREILTLWSHPHIAISAPGALLAVALTLRVATAVTFAMLLAWTTCWSDLLHALRDLRLPRVFLSVLAMTYRYLVVTLQTAADAFTARRSRTVGPLTSGEGRRFVGVSIGALFTKSLAMAEEVHGAMLARGFRGEMRTLAHSRWHTVDTVWTVGLSTAALILWRLG